MKKLRMPDSYQMTFVIGFSALMFIAARGDWPVGVGGFAVWFSFAFVGRNWL